MTNPLIFSHLATLLLDPPATSGIDWLYQFTNNLTNLTTQNGDALTQIGLTELSFVSLVVLVKMVIGWSTQSMTFHFHHQPAQAGDLVKFLLRLIGCCLMENYWVNPLPTASFGINHLFSYLAQVIVAALDQNSLTNLQHLLFDMGNGTTMPAIFNLREVICFFAIQVIVGLAGAILFLINCSSFIFYGVTALFGPIFIPLYMTKTFRAKFMHFLDALVSFAMIRAVASAFIFVWAGFLNGFVQQTFNRDYSLTMWLANLIPVVTVFIAFILNMLFIPTLTQAIFGGSAGLAGKLGESL